MNVDDETTAGDRELVEGAIGGSTLHFEQLMRRYNQRVYRTVLGIIGRPEDAEDAVQYAWLQAWRNLASFEGRASFATWLTKIAVRSAFAARSRENNQNNRPELRAEEESSVETPEKMAMTAELVQLLENEVLALPRDYRSVLALRDVEGLSTGECAEALELSEAAVRTRLHRARSMLRKRLQAIGADQLHSVMAFAGSRCDSAVSRVLEQISSEQKVN